MQNKTEIYQAYYPKALAYIRNRINEKEDAEDLAQTVFLKVFHKLDTFDETKSALSTWIYRITNNTLIDYYRTRTLCLYSPLTETMEDEDACDLAEGMILEEELDQLADALEALTETERHLILLHYYREYPLTKISDMMGLSYGQAKRLHQKALKKMADLLQDISE